MSLDLFFVFFCISEFGCFPMISVEIAHFSVVDGDGEGGAECRIPADLQIPADI